MHDVIKRFRTLSTATLAVAVFVGLSLTPAESSAADGETLFKTHCAACHSVGEGRRVGPDLKGVSDRHKPDWIVSFVQGSQKMVSDGDPAAVALFEEWKIPMPDLPLTQADVLAVIEYTKGTAAAPPTPAPKAPAASAEDVLLGQQLFQGDARLENGGPTCISCHDVTNDAIISGGVLATELTKVFGRLGGAGVRAVLGSPPFPVMQKAYKDRALTEAEVTALVGFLEKVNEEQATHMPRDTGIKLAASGVAGTILLLLLYTMMWSGRKRGSVNQAIYDRQVKSI